MQDPEIHRERREVLRAIADVAVKYDLPMPDSINFSSSGGVDIRLNNEDRDGVHRWTEATSNGEVTEKLVTDFTSVHSERKAWAGPTWLNLPTFYIWSACHTDDEVGAA